MSRRVVLLVNPTAGGGRGGRVAERAQARLSERGLTVGVVQGRSAAEAGDLLRSALADTSSGLHGVVAVGGDGLVSLAVQGVARSGVPLGIIPTGTGNDIARDLGLPLRDPEAAADLVAAGATREVDLGRAGERWFAGVLGSGFDSMVNERANRMSWPLGRSRYNVAILAELRTFRPLAYTLTLDGEVWETEAMLVAVGNTSSYGGGMRVCPGARPDDGLLDVTLLGPLPTWEFLRVFPSVYRGTHVRHRAVTVRTARRVTLVAEGVTAYADGERVGELPVDIAVVPGALRVFSGPAV